MLEAGLDSLSLAAVSDRPGTVSTPTPSALVHVILSRAVFS